MATRSWRARSSSSASWRSCSRWRGFRLPRSFREQALVKDWLAPRGGRARPGGLLGQAGRASSSTGSRSPSGPSNESNPPVLQVVRGRQAERLLQLPRPPRRGRATATRSPSTGVARRARSARSPTPSCTATCSGSPTRSGTAGSARATWSASTCRWSPSWPWRCSPARGSAPRTTSSSAASRRTPSRSGWSSRTRRRWSRSTARGARARRRRSSRPWTRRSATSTRSRRSSSSSTRARTARCTEGRDVWFHEALEAADDGLRARAARRRASAVRALHVGLDREAEGRPAHHRGLPARGQRSRTATSST